MTFALSQYFDDPSDQSPLSFIKIMGLFWGEVVSFLLFFNLSQLLFNKTKNPQASGDAPPLLFIHGFMCNAGLWYWFIKKLRKNHSVSCYCVSLDPFFSKLSRMAEQLEVEVERIQEIHPDQKISVIGHSMGGVLAFRWFAQVCKNPEAIHKVISVASPHKGTQLSRLIGRLGPASPKRLAAGVAQLTLPHAKLLSLYSPHDNIVSPRKSAHIEGIETVEISGFGHLQILFSAKLQRIIAANVQVEVKK